MFLMTDKRRNINMNMHNNRKTSTHVFKKHWKAHGNKNKHEHMNPSPYKDDSNHADALRTRATAGAKGARGGKEGKECQGGQGTEIKIKIKTKTQTEIKINR